MTFEIRGEDRSGTGRAANRQLRGSGRVPAIIYGGGKDPKSVSLDGNSLAHEMEREAFYTSILTVTVGSETHSVVVKDVQRHPARNEVVHLDFQRIVEDEEITLNVPLRLVGEESARGVKEQGGVIEHAMTDVEISCLPKDLPEFIEVDVSELGLNENLHLSDVRFPDGVTCVALAHDQDPSVVSIHPPRREEVDEPEVEGEAAGEEAATEAAEAKGDDDERESDGD